MITITDNDDDDDDGDDDSNDDEILVVGMAGCSDEIIMDPCS